MRDENIEYVVFYEAEHFERIKTYEYKEQYNPKFNVSNKIILKFALKLSDFDVEIKKKWVFNLFLFLMEFFVEEELKRISEKMKLFSIMEKLLENKISAIIKDELEKII